MSRLVMRACVSEIQSPGAVAPQSFLVLFQSTPGEFMAVPRPIFPLGEGGLAVALLGTSYPVKATDQRSIAAVAQVLSAELVTPERVRNGGRSGQRHNRFGGD